jgi:hypothetical protein
MKRWWKIAIPLAAAVVGAVVLWSVPNHALANLEKTRRSLRQAGFKVDLQEFDYSIPPDIQRRSALLGRTTRAELTNRASAAFTAPMMSDIPDVITDAGNNTAIPMWKRSRLPDYTGNDLWPGIKATLQASEPVLAAKREAAVSGPIRFKPVGWPGPQALLPYLGDMKALESAFCAQSMLALREGDRAAAWTNLVAATCLATAYVPEPNAISHLMRHGCVRTAFDVTWSVLQAGGWTDAQLQSLQRRWEEVNVWTNLSECAATDRAAGAALCEMERKDSASFGLTLKWIMGHPKDAVAVLSGEWQRVRYRHQGSYEDEAAILLFYRDREMEMRNAPHAKNWNEMRSLPGVTNRPVFTSPRTSRALAALNLRQMSMAVAGRGLGLAAGAAEAEARRRIVITALALERFHARNGRYPETLAALVPDFIQSPPVDFMDGQPLRYRLEDDGRFVLYSVGLDCVDNQGRMPKAERNGLPSRFGVAPNADLAWPRQASPAEIARFEAAETLLTDSRLKEGEDAQAAHWWARTAGRQLNVDAILALSKPTETNEPVINGRRLAESLSNLPGTNRPALADLLTLKQVLTGGEPETITFELPIKYDVLTNLGSAGLYIDIPTSDDDDEGCGVGYDECVRTADGGCRLIWNTIYEAPGRHALCAALDLSHPQFADNPMCGPALPVTITNLCQFTPESATFDPATGAKFYGRLPESNGVYRIELKSLKGELLKTITGSTTNGYIQERWDLTDERGRRCADQAFDSFFQITLPDSGRSQTLKGP